MGGRMPSTTTGAERIRWSLVAESLNRPYQGISAWHQIRRALAVLTLPRGS